MLINDNYRTYWKTPEYQRGRTDDVCSGFFPTRIRHVQLNSVCPSGKKREKSFFFLLERDGQKYNQTDVNELFDEPNHVL